MTKRRSVWVVEMADEQFGWVICATALNTRRSDAKKSRDEVQQGFPNCKLRIVRYDASK